MTISDRQRIGLSSMDFDVVSNSPRETIELGMRIGSQLKGGEVFALCGRLGSGKTCLVKGIAKGAGAADSRAVNSPTFVLINEYGGRLDIYHIDVYRLNSIEQFEMLGFDDFLGSGSVVLIEWADKIEPALQNTAYIRIELEHISLTERCIHISNAPEYIKI